jgi:hypothetical protein
MASSLAVSMMFARFQTQRADEKSPPPERVPTAGFSRYLMLRDGGRPMGRHCVA